MSAADVSVIIPTRNRAELAVRAVASVLAQTAPPGEIVVVDDASEDGTADIMSQRFPDITVIRTGHRIERAGARNLGARTARGGWLAFLDADDEWLPGKLAAQERWLEPGRATVTGVKFIDAGGDTRARPAPYVPPEPTFGRLLASNPVIAGASSIVISRDDFDSAGGFPTEWAVQGSEDWLFLLGLAAAGITVDVVPEPLVAYRIHSGNSTADVARTARAQAAAADWLVRGGALTASQAAMMRAGRYAQIASLHANRGDLREAWRWIAATSRCGHPASTARCAVTVPIAGCRGALRRASGRRRGG